METKSIELQDKQSDVEVMLTQESVMLSTIENIEKNSVKLHNTLVRLRISEKWYQRLAITDPSKEVRDMLSTVQASIREAEKNAKRDEKYKEFLQEQLNLLNKES